MNVALNVSNPHEYLGGEGPTLFVTMIGYHHMGAIIDLWGVEDERRLNRFLQAVEVGSPLDVVLALDVGDFGPLDAAIDAAAPSVADAYLFGGPMAVAAAFATLIEDTWGIQLEPSTSIRNEARITTAFADKKASPRTLAALWCYLAQRLDYEAHWLEMNVFHPIRISDGETEVLVDSTSGRMVSAADCRDIFDAVTDGDEPFLDEMLELPPTRTIAVQILELRLAGASEEHDETSAYRVMRFHAALHADQPRIVFAAALTAERIGDHVYAESTLRALVEECAGTSLEEPIRKALARLTERKHYVN